MRAYYDNEGNKIATSKANQGGCCGLIVAILMLLIVISAISALFH